MRWNEVTEDLHPDVPQEKGGMIMMQYDQRWSLLEPLLRQYDMAQREKDAASAAASQEVNVQDQIAKLLHQTEYFTTADDGLKRQLYNQAARKVKRPIDNRNTDLSDSDVEAARLGAEIQQMLNYFENRYGVEKDEIVKLAIGNNQLNLAGLDLGKPAKA